MKTLRKGDKFKRLKDSTVAHCEAIKKLVDSGWSYCDKTTWREMRDGSGGKCVMIVVAARAEVAVLWGWLVFSFLAIVLT